MQVSGQMADMEKTMSEPREKKELKHEKITTLEEENENMKVALQRQQEELIAKQHKNPVLAVAVRKADIDLAFLMRENGPRVASKGLERLYDAFRIVRIDSNPKIYI